MQKTEIKRYIYMTIGIFIAACSIKFLLIPTNISSGGVTGLSIVIYNLTGIPVNIMVFGINIVFLLLALVFLGKEIFFTTLYGSLLFPIFLSILPDIDLTRGDILMAMIAGGATSGVGFGIVFLTGGSTGGTSLPPYFLKKSFGMSLTTGFLLADIVSVGANIFMGDYTNVIYGTIAVVTLKVVADYVETGLTRRKAVYILSDASEEISTFIHTELNRGSTNIQVVTGYMKEEKPMILAVVSSRELFTLKEQIKTLDPYAFILISTVSEVEGRGFTISKDTITKIA